MGSLAFYLFLVVILQLISSVKINYLERASVFFCYLCLIRSLRNLVGHCNTKGCSDWNSLLLNSYYYMLDRKLNFVAKSNIES